ncbi:sugar-binding transcriptional regulator [Salinicoccus hispanicus]|uniref:Sugar-binding transcriptional regulator n=1 Tax=Salinicoccus hispanicus TaxID=157225 RepID=A0A6N8U5B4_9STAP|nr:sugar-binding transcriptional regulator [Salinicoccus hispanicus]MXQ51491.1 sugar-binding transcriptional regulator [Salinicoccus hispanicus]
MRAIVDDKKLIVKVCKLYYFDGMTQAQIAKRIGVSRPIVSKMLSKAKEEKIVEIFIKDESAHTVDLELHIEKKYGIKEAIVVSKSGYGSGVLLDLLGQAAASYVSKKIGNIGSLGISWGKSVSSFVDAYPFEKNENVKVVPLIGGMGRSELDLHSNMLTLKLAQKLHTHCSYLYAPAMLKNIDTKNRLLESEDINGVLQEGNAVDMAIVGIGNPVVHSTMEEIGYLSNEDVESLRESSAIGDINSFFFDIDGVPLTHPLNDSIIGVDLESLKAIGTTIAIATGDNKTLSIHSALLGGAVDVLVTDDETAQKILDIEQK